MRTAVVAGGDASLILELAEHVFDLVTLAIERLVIVDWLPAAFGGRNARLDAPVGEGFAEPIAVVALVAKQAGGERQHVE